MNGKISRFARNDRKAQYLISTNNTRIVISTNNNIPYCHFDEQ